jgi:hypothetical protein
MKGKPIRGIKGLNKTLRQLPKEAKVRLRDASVAIASDVAREATSRATGQGGIARYVAPTIRAARGTVPTIKMGGSRALPPHEGRARTGSRQTVGDIVWGAEYGATHYRQFKPWGGTAGSAGYFLWPSIDMDEVEQAYGDALLDACRDA